jgi:hypothetical protein
MILSAPFLLSHSTTTAVIALFEWEGQQSRYVASFVEPNREKKMKARLTKRSCEKKKKLKHTA